MCRSEHEQLHLAAADVERQSFAEGAVGVAQAHGGQIERGEHVGDVAVEPAERAGRPPGEPGQAREAGERLGRGLGVHRLAARRARDDLGLGRHRRVAPPVVAVGVRVEHRADRRITHMGRHRLEHLSRERLVPEGVDEHRSAVADDEPGVGLAPGAVGLQPGLRAGSDLSQSALEARGPAVSGTTAEVTRPTLTQTHRDVH